MLSYNGADILRAPSSLIRPVPAMGNLNSTQSTKPGTQYIWIITGPSGCGKSTVAAFLAKALDLPFIEGDDYHPNSNREKMANGIPLTDDDRWNWLETIRKRAVEELQSGSQGCVVTCSALKRVYRDVIRVASQEAENVCVRFVYLRASEDLLRQRVASRQGHFFKDNMVRGQFSILEEPDETEQDVIAVDVSNSLTNVTSEALAKVQTVMHSEW